MSQKSNEAIFFQSPIKKQFNSVHLIPPIISLKKFCQSLPCSQTKPSCLNLIRWQKHNYAPNEKQKRWKLQNDTVKHHLAREKMEEKKGIPKRQIKTQPNQTLNMPYRTQFVKIRAQELTTAIVSKQEEQVFSNIKDDSLQDQFKRNYSNAWNFIIRNKKFSTGQTESSVPRKNTVSSSKKDVQKLRLQKKLLNQKLKTCIQKWNPKIDESKSAGNSLKKTYSTKNTF